MWHGPYVGIPKFTTWTMDNNSWMMNSILILNIINPQCPKIWFHNPINFISRLINYEWNWPFSWLTNIWINFNCICSAYECHSASIWACKWMKQKYFANSRWLIENYTYGESNRSLAMMTPYDNQLCRFNLLQLDYQNSIFDSVDCRYPIAYRS